MADKPAPRHAIVKGAERPERPSGSLQFGGNFPQYLGPGQGSRLIFGADFSFMCGQPRCHARLLRHEAA